MCCICACTHLCVCTAQSICWPWEGSRLLNPTPWEKLGSPPLVACYFIYAKIMPSSNYRGAKFVKGDLATAIFQYLDIQTMSKDLSHVQWISWHPRERRLRGNSISSFPSLIHLHFFFTETRKRADTKPKMYPLVLTQLQLCTVPCWTLQIHCETILLDFSVLTWYLTHLPTYMLWVTSTSSSEQFL